MKLEPQDLANVDPLENFELETQDFTNSLESIKLEPQDLENYECEISNLLSICEETSVELDKQKQMKSEEEKKRRHCNERNEETSKTKKRKTNENKHFKKNIEKLTAKEDTDSELLTEHLDEKLTKRIQTDIEKMKENIPKIKRTFDTIFSFVLTLEKTLEKIPTYEDPHTKELKVSCEGCPIHCIPNWHFTRPTGRPSTSSSIQWQQHK